MCNLIKMKHEAEKTAILFIEYQNEFLSEGGNLSKDIILELNGSDDILTFQRPSKGMGTKMATFLRGLREAVIYVLAEFVR